MHEHNDNVEMRWRRKYFYGVQFVRSGDKEKQ